ncbi:hypothetical protein N7486_006843, partial [Penicillium sp. IBT 16267x]
GGEAKEGGLRSGLLKGKWESWPNNSFNNKPDGYESRPIFHHQPATDPTPERVVIHCIRREFTGAFATPRSNKIPPITEAQAEALDVIHFLAEKHQLRLDFQNGDIQYTNNFSIVHSGESLKDTPKQQRHLIRRLLRDPEHAWVIPGPLKERIGRVYNNMDKDTQEFPLDVQVESCKPRS